MKTHKITIRQKPDTQDRIMTGSNTDIFFDGKPLLGSISVKFEVNSKSAAKVWIEMVAEVDIEGNIHTELTPTQKAEQTYLRQLGSIAFNKKMCELGLCAHSDEAHTKYHHDNEDAD